MVLSAGQFLYQSSAGTFSRASKNAFEERRILLDIITFILFLVFIFIIKFSIFL
jgi:hypothetical protein